MVERHLFGTDGVRGVANDGLTPEIAFDLARAAGEGRDGNVVVGRDTRVSGPMVLDAVCAALVSTGHDVWDIGIATTPTTEVAVQESAPPVKPWSAQVAPPRSDPSQDSSPCRTPSPQYSPSTQPG